MHVALRIAYDGTRFKGLARQPSGDTVEDALAKALGDDLVPGSLRVGSRTDAGVSAIANVVKAELRRSHLRGLIPAVAGKLPDGVWVTGVAEVAESWHVRHATARTYAYLVARGEEDEATMTAACAAFVGDHDFSAFAKLEDRTPQRRVDAMQVIADGQWWRFTITAPGFLWNQVRRMVDAALAIGQGRAATSDILAALSTGVAHPAFQVAPAPGLILQEVIYNPPLQWASEAGFVPPAKVNRPLQAARAKMDLLEGLQSNE